MSYERTVEGTERYYQTRERAAKIAWRTANRKFTEKELVDLLTGFALDERKREEQAKLDPVVQEFKKQETAVERVVAQADIDCACFAKARTKGEPVFVLRAQDYSAGPVVREWVRRNADTCSPEKLADALRIAQAMDRWRSKKLAD